jgi:23S rRNA (cytosine1962-C5)-methyltransferase
MRHYSYAPAVYPAMLGPASNDARPGDFVHVYDKYGQSFGMGLYNPRARVPLRMFHHGTEPQTEDFWTVLLDRAIDLRLKVLDTPAGTDAYRVVHSDGDGLGGLIVDRFGDVLSIQVHSLGIFQRLPKFVAHLHARLGTTRAVVEVDPNIARFEGIPLRDVKSDPVRTIKIREHGVRYEVDFTSGHKTGFFCDQRENRRRLAGLTKDKRVLDLCCYTGGFALSAKVVGGASEVTAVDLDEAAIESAKRNANLNNVRINWIHCDAFSYARQMQKNIEQWDVVVLDPPKLLLSRDEIQEGERKYDDLNALGLMRVAPGGLFLTCSCSGLLNAEAFEELVIKAAHRVERRLQILDRTGAATDHPVMSNCPESRYLKALWARVW